MSSKEHVTQEAKFVTMIDDPSTAQEVGAIIQITDLTEAANFLKLQEDYDVPTLLALFEKRIHEAIDSQRTRFLKPLTDAKNIILRHEVERMIEASGRFDFTDLIPFDSVCVNCRGTGELYKFYRRGITAPCKFCDGKGTRLITCRTCHGTARYKKFQDDLRVNVRCTRCEVDENGEPTGKERVKCRNCRGSGEWKHVALDSKIKSTTHCHACKGRGFPLPEPEKPAREPDNPVIDQDLGAQIKSTVVKE